MVPVHMRVSFVFLGVVVLSAALGCGCADHSVPVVRTYQMGDKVSIGSLLYTVLETQWLTQVGVPPDEKVPQHRFFLVRVSIVSRSGHDDVMVPNLSVEDDSGKSYSELSSDIGAPQWIGLLRQLHPADSMAGNLVFDCPPGHYKLRVLDDAAENAALVDIPLTFTSETPDVPVAADPKKK